MSYSIKAYLRIDKQNAATGQCPVALVVILQGKQLKFTISNQQIHPGVWDKSKGVVDISKLPKNAEHKTVKGDCEELNRFILQKVSDFNRFMLEQGRLRISVTPERVKLFMAMGRIQNFYTFWDEQMDLMKPQLKSSTMFSYENTKKILMEFKPHLEFGDFNLELIRKFDNYLTTVRNNHTGGKYNRHKNLKAILKQALRSKLIDENPYQYFKVEAAKGNRMRLSLEELKVLKNLTLPDEHRNLEKVKDMFLFGCYTGLRFSDMQNLKWKDIDFAESKIELTMVKTSNNIRIALIPDVIQILQNLRKYQLRESYVFKRITNQAMNRSLKVIMGLVGTKKRITFHCARHTFATIHLEVGTNIYQVKDLLGHQSIADTQIYAKNLQESIDNSMAHFGQMLVASVNNSTITPVIDIHASVR